MSFGVTYMMPKDENVLNIFTCSTQCNCPM